MIDGRRSFASSDTPLNRDFTLRQSAVIKVPLPSTQTLTYIIAKPDNETAELMLANVRLSARNTVAHTMI